MDMQMANGLAGNLSHVYAQVVTVGLVFYKSCVQIIYGALKQFKKIHFFLNGQGYHGSIVPLGNKLDVANAHRER